MWPSDKAVVKVGGQGRTNVPGAVVEDYGDRYPSKLPGGSLEGPLPPGPEEKLKTNPEDDEQYDPNNPKANLDNYDPDKVKIPEKKVEPAKLPDQKTEEKKDDKKKPKK